MKANHIFAFTSACAILAACEVPNVELAETQEKNNMALDYTTPIIPIIDPNSLVPADPAATIYKEKPGTPTNSADDGANFQIVENQIFTLNGAKVNRAGDTMTDTLIVNASSPNNNAIVGTGDGVGFGVVGIGGATGGGGRFVGTGNGSMGVSAVGGPNGGSGIVASGTGNDGLAAELYVGTVPTATMPRLGVYLQGLVRFDGVPPNANVDPGFDNAVGKQNIVSSSALVTSNSFTVNAAGFNVATFAGTALGVAIITFARPLPGTNYRIHVMCQDGYDARWNGVQNVGNYQFVVRDMTTNATVDLTTTTITFFVSTIGY
jgi:hypothetical protein